MKQPMHTPGPWEATAHGDYGDYDGQCIVVIGDGKRLCVVQGPDDPETHANADLIIRAPDMDAALRDCLALAARHRHEEWAQHVMRFCANGGVVPSPLRGE